MEVQFIYFLERGAFLPQVKNSYYNYMKNLTTLTIAMQFYIYNNLLLLFFKCQEIFAFLSSALQYLPNLLLVGHYIPLQI